MNLNDFLGKVIRGDVAAVGAALKAQPELRDARGEWNPLFIGWNALWVAIMYGRADMVKLLIAHGARAAPDNPVDVSPLAAAAVEGRRDVVKILLDTGATVDIFAACALGDGPRAAALLTDNPELARARTSDGRPSISAGRGTAASLSRQGRRHSGIGHPGLTPHSGLPRLAVQGRLPYLIARSEGVL